MKKLTTLIAVALMIITTSCSKDSIRGEGNTVSKQRDLDSFTSVQVEGDIKLHIAHGTTAVTEVRGYENLVNITETNVVNGKLTVKYKRDYYNVRNSNIELYIIMPELKAVATNGSGDVWVDGFVNGNRLEASVNGSSNININNSNYGDVSFDLNGSGDIRAAGLQTRTTNATIHGSGDIETSCSQHLRARVFGSGDIRYWGSPTLDVEVNGSGRISRQ